jgi:hypothetical protein
MQFTRASILLPRRAEDPGHLIASIVYLVLFAASIVVAWVLRDDDGAADSLGNSSLCEQSVELPGPACFRKEAVLRVSAGSIIYFTAQLLAVLVARVARWSQPVPAVTLAHGGVLPRPQHLPAVTHTLSRRSIQPALPVPSARRWRSALHAAMPGGTLSLCTLRKSTVLVAKRTIFTLPTECARMQRFGQSGCLCG